MILIDIVLLTIFFVLMLLGFAFIYGFISNKSSANIQKTFGKTGFIIFSFIGTPVHEISHWIACKIFRHKVEKVCLFSPSKLETTGQLGCVEHSYNPKKLWQQAGNFIIGVAPIISGIGISYLIMKFCMHGGSFIPKIDSISISVILNSLKNMIFELLGVFNIQNIKTPLFWIGLFILINIFLHVTISKADLKNAILGMVFFIILIPTLSLIFALFGIAPADFSVFCLKVDFAFLFMLIFGLVIDLFIWALSALAFKLKKIYYLKKKNLILK